MRRGTTPEYELTVPDYDLTDKTVFVTLAQDNRKVTKTGDQLIITGDSSGSVIVFSLTQQDTLAMHTGKASVQVRFIDYAGVAYATDIGTLYVDPVLLERVIAYAED